MPLGSLVRSKLGPFEKAITQVYCAAFFDSNALINKIKEIIPDGDLKILELGCGEGMFAINLLKAYRCASLTGIDIKENAGRMCRDYSDRAVFRRETIEDLVLKNGHSFDLLTIIDVLHHIPKDAHHEFLLNAKRTLKPGGTIVVKEWVRTFVPIHFLVHFLDRFITGDHVFYRTSDDLRRLITDSFGENSIKYEMSVWPWSNNRAFFIHF